MTPTIAEINSDLCALELRDPSGKFKYSDVALGDSLDSLPIAPSYQTGQIAVTFNRGPEALWDLIPADITINSERTYLVAHAIDVACSNIAYPIDPRMTKADIEGAAIIKPNSTNDGWLFYHTEPGTHHDHEIQVVSAISGLIEPLICKYQLDVLDADSDTKKKKARDGIAALKVFYNLLLTNAQKVSRSAYLGQRAKEPHPAKGHLHNDLVSTYNAAKMELSKNRTKALKDDLDLMDNILAMQTPETRWDMAARIEAEKKAEEQNDNT